MIIAQLRLGHNVPDKRLLSSTKVLVLLELGLCSVRDERPSGLQARHCFSLRPENHSLTLRVCSPSLCIQNLSGASM